MSVITKRNIVSGRCAPVATSTKPPEGPSHIWSLTQMSSGILGVESLTLACIRNELRDENGIVWGQDIHPVVVDIQHDPLVARQLRTLEFRAGVTVDGKTGLVYRLRPRWGAPPNSWLTSAESVMREHAGTWGYVYSDREAEVYRFHRLNINQPAPASFPDIKELVDELLAEYVIDSLEHPVLQRLLGLTSTSSPAAPSPAPSTPSIQEDEEDIYD